MVGSEDHDLHRSTDGCIRCGDVGHAKVTLKLCGHIDDARDSILSTSAQRMRARWQVELHSAQSSCGLARQGTEAGAFWEQSIWRHAQAWRCRAISNRHRPKVLQFASGVLSGTTIRLNHRVQGNGFDQRRTFPEVRRGAA